MNTQGKPSLTVTTTKKEQRVLRWLQAQTSTDPYRESLTVIHVENGDLMTADGFKLAIAPLVSVYSLALQTNGRPLNVKSAGKLRISDRENEFTVEQDNYHPGPGLLKHMQENKEAPKQELYLNRDLLVEAIKEMPTSGAVKLEIYGPEKPVKIVSRDEDETEFTLWFMPMARPTETTKRW